ncbi:retrovirus-related pol polyprotein from transposon TNT 1-94 [Tanacetum coccineum]
MSNHNTSTLSQALISIFKAHKDRIGMSHKKSVEKAFQVKADSHVRENLILKVEAEDEKEEDSMDEVVCKNCKKLGHKESECWFKQKGDQHASFVEKKNEETLFMTYIHDGSVPTDFWFIDSGCSSHMCRSGSLFMDLDTSEKSTVRLGDDIQVQIEGKGSVAINTTTDKKKVLHDVLFVPKLAHNLLSIGQLMSSGLVIVFDDGYCYIQDKRFGQRIAKVGMTTNKMFPLDGSSVKEKAMVVKAWKDSDIWNLRYGHSHLNGLELLKNKDMIMGLPNIDDLEFCEGCVLGKQSRNSFPVGKSWRASRHRVIEWDSVFGPWLNLKDFSNDNHMLNYVLQHQVHVKEFSADCPPILFKISNHYLYFGHDEFCLVTGFRCGELSEYCALDDEDTVRVVDYVNGVQEDCTLVEQTKKPSCSTPVQVDAVINQGVPLVQGTPHVLGNGMVDQLKSKVIDTLTTTLESARKHAEVVEAEVVNCERNLVECPLVEKDVGVLRVAVDSYDMNLVDCPVVHKENSEPKHFTFTDTQPSTMEHLVNACAFVSPPFPFYDSPKADQCVEPAQDTNDTDDDYMDFENDPSQYCLDNMTIGIEEDTKNGELTVSLYEEPQKETAKCSEHTEKIGLRGEDKQIANENNDFDTLLKVLRRNCKSNPTKVNYGIVVDEHFWLALLGLDENRTGWMLDDVANADWSIIGPHFCPSILSGQMSLFYASNKRYHVPWSDVEKVYIPLSNLKTHWALAELEL